jgi:hypothetical protein
MKAKAAVRFERGLAVDRSTVFASKLLVSATFNHKQLQQPMGALR